MSQPKQKKEYTILIVDDEELLRETIAFDLERIGFTVLQAGSGEEAFEIVKGKTIHLVISDIRMPKGDGVSLLENIRANNPIIPVVILVTGFADISEEECKAKGAHLVVQKPFERIDFINAVFSALGLPQDSFIDY